MSSDKKDNSPPKSGNLWLESDAREVKKLLSENKSIADIAKAVGRTDGAIKTRFKLWALKEISTGGNRDEVFKKYKMLAEDGSVVKAPAYYWNPEEVKLLIQYTDENKSLPEISKLLLRTENNVLSKLNTMAYDEIKNGASKDTTIIKYKLNKDKYEKFELKKNKAKTQKSTETPTIDLTEITQKINTLTNLVNLVLKNQEEHSKKLDVIQKFCDQ